MSYNVNWHTDDQVILIRVADQLSLDELQAMDEDIRAEFNQYNHPIHLLFELDNLQRVPTNILHLKKALQFLQHRNMGMIVIVGANPLVKYLASTLTALSKVQLKTSKKLDEAIRTCLNNHKRLSRVRIEAR